MKIKTRKYVKVYYDPERCDWDAVTEQELKRRGLRRGKIAVICKPKKEPNKNTRAIAMQHSASARWVK